jgi:copper transport protein
VRADRIATALGALLTVAVVGLWPAPATAQGTGVVSDPADNAVLDRAPVRVSLTGPSASDPAASHVTLWNEAGVSLDTNAALHTDGDTLSRTVVIPAAGNYTITYHLVFTDGADAVGTIRFSVGTGAPPPAGDLPAPVADDLTSHQHGVDAFGATLLVVDALFLGGVILMLIAKPKIRRTGTHKDAEPDTG